MESREQYQERIDALARQAVLADFSHDDDYAAFKESIAVLRASLCSDTRDDAVRVVDVFSHACEQVDRTDAAMSEQVIRYGIEVLNAVLLYPEADRSPAYTADTVRETFERFLKKEAMQPNDYHAVRADELPGFIANTRSVIDDIEHECLRLESDATLSDSVHALFRFFHTIKGEAGLLGLTAVSAFAHEVETFLEPYRTGTGELDTPAVSILLESCDLVRNIIGALEEDRLDEQQKNIDVLILRIRKHTVPENDQPAEPDDTAAPAVPAGAETFHFTPTIPVLDLPDSLDVITEFIAESEDHLSASEGALLTLEKNPEDRAEVDRIFRAFHTMKGIAGFINLEDLKHLAHDTETMMDCVRRGDADLSPAIADATLAAIDATRQLLVLLKEQVENNGSLTSTYYDVGPVLKQINATVETIRPSVRERPKIGTLLVDQGIVTHEEVENALEVQEREGGARKIGEILVDGQAATPAQINRSLQAQRGGTAVENAVKIGITKLDNLIDTVGELVIMGTQVCHSPLVAESVNNRFERDIAQLSRIIRDVQDITMTMRLVPIKPVFQKMVRVIRDLSKKTGKEVSVTLAGEETELDKSITDVIGDPLLHMVRNAVDHGIEAPGVRIANGKPSNGTVALRAYHKAGSIIIEIRDDGRGLDKDKILVKARERGLVAAHEHVEESRIYNFIFEPGFSTADKVTDVSGRGVGMDVVKRNIEQLRGKVDISSKVGAGSVFTIRLPLTLAIIDSIIVRVGSQRCVLPITAVIEFLQPKNENIIIAYDRGECIRIHGNLHPVIRLHDFFGDKPAPGDYETLTGCLVDSDFGPVCLFVDELIGQQQVVIKSLGKKLSQVRGQAGAAILGNGAVGLILDINGIVTYARSRTDAVLQQ